MILNAPLQNENTEWFAATKRRKTLIEKHKNPGKMPGFKSRKRDDQTFVCFHLHVLQIAGLQRNHPMLRIPYVLL